MILKTRKLRDIDLFLYEDGLWRDEHGTIYAIPDETFDAEDARCGVGVFSLPKESTLNRACRTHDSAYTNETIQKFYSRKEIDRKLLSDLKTIGANSLAALGMYKIVRLLGRFFWEGKR